MGDILVFEFVFGVAQVVQETHTVIYLFNISMTATFVSRVFTLRAQSLHPIQSFQPSIILP